MFQDRFLNYCLIVSFICHIILLASILKFPFKPLTKHSFTPIELVVIKEVAPLPRLSSTKIPLPAKPQNEALNAQNILNLNEANQPHISLTKNEMSLSSAPKVAEKQTNYLRGGETTCIDLKLPLQSSYKADDFEVNFSNNKNYDKVIPNFEEPGLDLNGEALFAKPSTDFSASAAAVNNVVVNSTQVLGKRGMASLIEQYRKELIERIRSVIGYPEWAREHGIGGQVTLEVLIKRDGVISNIQVSKSSGDSRLDKEAVRSVASMTSFPAFPSAMEMAQAKLIIPVNYNLQ